MTEQTRANGSLRHLLTLEGLSKAQLEALLTRAQKFVKPVGEPPVQKKQPRRHHRGQHVHRAFDAHARVVRAGRQAAGRRRGEPRGAAVLARQGREHARHHLHARSLPRRRIRDSRRRSRRARPGRRARAAARQRAVGRRSARVASHAGPARRADHPAGQEEVRRAQGRDRRRRQAFARGALGLAGARQRSASARSASSRRGR